MSQLSTLAAAKKNEARLKVLMPTYGIFANVNGHIFDENQFVEKGIAQNGAEAFLFVRLNVPQFDDEGMIVVSSKDMTSALISQTFQNSPNATEFAIRIVSMVEPGISRDQAIAKIAALPTVSVSTEAILAEAFK